MHKKAGRRRRLGKAPGEVHAVEIEWRDRWKAKMKAGMGASVPWIFPDERVFISLKVAFLHSFDLLHTLHLRAIQEIKAYLQDLCLLYHANQLILGSKMRLVESHNWMAAVFHP